ncbi:MAG: hypothetical protein U0R65_06890 [Candidatus Nanopelagicales bacterium]
MARRLTMGVMAVALAATALAPAAQAAERAKAPLRGAWTSVSLRQDGVGYAMRLTPTATTGQYKATLRMTFQDGTKSGPVRGVVSVDGTAASLRVIGEGTILGSLGQDGALFFPRCGRVLDNIVAGSADTMCMFQQFS